MRNEGHRWVLRRTIAIKGICWMGYGLSFKPNGALMAISKRNGAGLRISIGPSWPVVIALFILRQCGIVVCPLWVVAMPLAMPMAVLVTIFVIVAIHLAMKALAKRIIGD